MRGKDILLSLVTGAELHCKVNPLRRTEVPAKKIVFLSFWRWREGCSGLADLSCVFLNRARGNMRQGPWRYSLCLVLARMQELLSGWVGIQTVTQAWSLCKYFHTGNDPQVCMKSPELISNTINVGHGGIPQVCEELALAHQERCKIGVLFRSTPREE